MAFGQNSGPPAHHKQVTRIIELAQAAGHSDLRDARGPLGLTQRQAGGKFTKSEAEALIELLEQAAESGTEPATPTVRLTAAEQTARALPAEVLAAELQRRGWVVMEP